MPGSTEMPVLMHQMYPGSPKTVPMGMMKLVEQYCVNLFPMPGCENLAAIYSHGGMSPPQIIAAVFGHTWSQQWSHVRYWENKLKLAAIGKQLAELVEFYEKHGTNKEEPK